MFSSYIAIDKEGGQKGQKNPRHDPPGIPPDPHGPGKHDPRSPLPQQDHRPEVRHGAWQRQRVAHT